MSTTIRPETSAKNKYWISRHRYYELKHFCLQYNQWKAEYAALPADTLNAHSPESLSDTSSISNPTEDRSVRRTYYLERIEMIEKVAKLTDQFLAPYIILGVTRGMPYAAMKAQLDIPCCKDVYYHLYRRFFWLLDKERQ